MKQSANMAVGARPIRSTVLFAGGGSGGHLFPGLAIAEHIRESAPDVTTRFCCSDRPLDTHILDREGASFFTVPAQPMSLRPRGFLRFLRGWGPTIRAARAEIRAAKSRGAVVVAAMGGFVAAPVVRAARSEKIPVVLVNLDAVPGKANLWIGRQSAVRLTALPVADAPGWEVIGPVVRRAARAPRDQGRCREAFGLDPDLRTLFVSGGSQGARTINELMLDLITNQRSLFEDWQVIHQCGSGADSVLSNAYSQAGIRSHVTEFIENVGDAWGASNLAVARSGAGTVAEVWANRVPAIFLPYPFHRDQHQQQNARALKECGGAIIIQDLIDAAQNASAIRPVLTALMNSDEKLGKMASSLERLGPADGAECAAGRLLSVLRERV